MDMAGYHWRDSIIKLFSLGIDQRHKKIINIFIG